MAEQAYLYITDWWNQPLLNLASHSNTCNYFNCYAPLVLAEFQAFNRLLFKLVNQYLFYVNSILIREYYF